MVTSVPWSGQSATPMLAPSWTVTPRTTNGALERAGEPQRELDGRAAVGQPAQQHRELVAAEPREHVAAPQRAAQPLGDVAQEPVAVVVAERVVDLLEPVEVDQQQADRPAAQPHAARSRAGRGGTARSGSAAR